MGGGPVDLTHLKFSNFRLGRPRNVGARASSCSTAIRGPHSFGSAARRRAYLCMVRQMSSPLQRLRRLCHHRASL